MLTQGQSYKLVCISSRTWSLTYRYSIPREVITEWFVQLDLDYVRGIKDPSCFDVAA